MEKKELSARQGLEAACILFELNSRSHDIVRMAQGAGLPPALLSGTGAEQLCAEWRAFVHAVVTAGLMQFAPNVVLVAYLRQTGHALRAAQGQMTDQAQPMHDESPQAQADCQAFVDGPFAAYMPLLAGEAQARCPALFLQRLARSLAEAGAETDILAQAPASLQARLAAIMALLISAVWDKLDAYHILPD